MTGLGMTEAGIDWGFSHDTPPLRTITSRDSGGCVHDEMSAAGLGRALIVCSAREAKSPLCRKISGALGTMCAGLFDGVTSHPTLAAAERGAGLARRVAADCLVVLGGGGASDQAKGIALWIAEDGALEPISAANTEPRPPFTGAPGKALPIIVVPTTASGAELTPGFAQCDETGRKLLFRDARLFPRLIVLDPDAMALTPVEILVPSCMNAIAHCIEALYSRGRDPISDVFAVSGFTRVYGALGGLADRPGDPGAIRELLIGANLAGRAIVNARTGIHHACCHVLGAAGVSHGVANAIMLPHAIAFNARAAADRLAVLEDALARGGERRPLAGAVEELCARFTLPRRLREVGIDRSRIPALVAQLMMEPGLRFNPRQNVTPAQATVLYEAAW